MSRWNLGRNALSICLVLGLLNTIQGALSLVNLYRSRDTVNALNGDNFKALFWAGKLKGVAKDQRLAIVNYINADNEQEWTKFAAQVAKADADLKDIRNQYPKADPRDVQAIATMAMEQGKFFQAWLEIRDLAPQGKKKEAREVYDTKLMAATLGRRKMEDYLADTDQERGEQLTENARDAIAAGIPVVWTILFLTLGLGTGAFLLFARSVRRTHGQLQEASDRLILATRAGGVGVWVHDIVKNRMVFDEQMCRLYGLSGERFECSWDECRLMVHPEDRERLKRESREASEGRRIAEFEYRIVWPDGSIHHIRAFAQVQRNEAGNLVRVIGTNWDITAQKQADEELLESNRRLGEETVRVRELAREAEKANAAKSEFLANMSHEIRTPMNGVIGMTGLLLDTELLPQQRHYAETVRASGESLLSLINDILDYSKIEAHKLELETVEFSLPVLLDDLAATMAVQAYAKGLEIFAITDAGASATFRGDPGRLRQILTNLAGNAIKFTTEGEVIVRACLEEESESECMLRFAVRDTGMGIPEDKLGILFDKFSQVDASTTRTFGGTGLGLAISKQLAECMGGEMGVTSEVGKGSEFWFTVRLGRSHRAEAARPEIHKTARLDGVRVLIIDDNATSREILSALTASWGMRPDEAEGGPWGLQAIYKALGENDPFRIVITDMQMPGMDGEAVGRAIRADARLADTRLVMLTSLGVRHGAQHYEEIGFSSCATKPIRRVELLNLLSQALGDPADRMAEPAKMPEPAAPQQSPVALTAAALGNARILLAEDNFTNQEVALGILKKLGMRADAVANGMEVLKSLETIPYDLVFMDVRMPVMDGIEATRRIRDARTPVLNHAIPIVAMTANALQADRESCLRAGMNGFVPKPIVPAVLREALEQWLPAVDSKAAATRQAPAAAPVPEVDAAVFDREGMLKRLMRDERLVGKVLDAFLGDLPLQIQALKESLAAGDANVSGRVAHSIKGAAANVGGEGLRQVAAGMEKAADGGDLDAVKGALAELEAKALELTLAIEASRPASQDAVKG